MADRLRARSRTALAGIGFAAGVPCCGFPGRGSVLTFLAAGLVLLALFRVLAALVTERRRAGFSDFVMGAAADIDPRFPGLRPSPVDLAS